MVSSNFNPASSEEAGAADGAAGSGALVFGSGIAGAAGGVALSAGCAEGLFKAPPADAAMLLIGVATAAGPGIM